MFRYKTRCFSQIYTSNFYRKPLHFYNEENWNKLRIKYFSKLYNIQEKQIKPCSFSKDKLKGLHKQNKFQEFKLYSSKTSDDSICVGDVCRLKLRWFMDWTRTFFLSCLLRQSEYQYASKEEVLLFQSFINEIKEKKGNLQKLSGSTVTLQQTINPFCLLADSSQTHQVRYKVHHDKWCRFSYIEIIWFHWFLNHFSYISVLYK